MIYYTANATELFKDRGRRKKEERKNKHYDNNRFLQKKLQKPNKTLEYVYAVQKNKTTTAAS
jgi:hypothetical protein